MENIKAILFDFDGTLANTMEDLFSAWEKSFLKFGVQINKDDYFPLEGTKVLDIARIISEKYNLKADFEEIVKLKEEFYLQNNSFSFYPGVIELIDNLSKSKIKIAIVSASSKEKLEKTAPKIFLDKFDAIITSEYCNFGKPNPEPYLKAMNKLNLNPNECVVVENAPLGIKSAKNASMFCIAITSTVSADKLKEADLIVDKFADLKNLDIFKKLIK